MQEPSTKVAAALLCVAAIVTSCNTVRRGKPAAADLQPIREALYVGSYQRVPVKLDPKTPFDSLQFEVVEGAAAGVVSASRDETFNLKRPDVVLIAGATPGSYHLTVKDRATGAILDTEPFQVTDHVGPGDRGPSVVIHSEDPRTTSSAWGGGPAGPQNVNIHPALGTRRIAVVFVDTTDQRFSTTPGDFDAIRDHWRDAIIDGEGVAGVTFSLRRYYQESSRGLMDVTADFFGPFAMAGDWATVGAEAGFGAHIQAAMTAADAAVNYSNYDTILVVSQSVIGTGGADDRFAWPIASIGSWGGWVNGDGKSVLGAIQMPFDWDVRDARRIWETASHELGHNLGMGDLYTPGVAGRNVDAWDLMHADGALPEFTIAHKLRLGWVDPSWVRAFDFATLGAPVDQTVSLAPSSLGAPPAGSFSGAEIRLTDGWNYYFEYRTDDPTRIGDRELPANDRVLGTDVVSAPFTAPISRPYALLLPVDSDGDGPVLDNGDDFHQTDTTSPTFPVEFRADVSGIDGNHADLRVRYGVNGKPDPSIRPWGAPPWQTADIEVRNERNRVDPAWFNVPWGGNPNQVVAKVKNNGTLDAPAVRVEFYVKNYNVGGTPETFLGADTRDIAAGATVEFQADWLAPSSGHYCIVVRIPLYVTPGVTPVAEMTELNNLAQSNYDRFISSTASPAVRLRTQVEVGNPYPRKTRVYLDIEQTNPLYRTYLDHRWLDLDAGETTRVGVMLEFVGSSRGRERPDDREQRWMRAPNDVAISAWIVDPGDEHGHHIVLLGGTSAQVATGKATRIDEFAWNDNGVRGRVIDSDRTPVDGGHVILTIRTKGRSGDEVTNASVPVRDGSFAATVRAQSGTVAAYFAPPPGFGDSSAGPIPIGR
ncbi:MAG: CARDB domain-containing protein [Planctomycetota bacterium]